VVHRYPICGTPGPHQWYTGTPDYGTPVRICGTPDSPPLVHRYSTCGTLGPHLWYIWSAWRRGRGGGGHLWAVCKHSPHASSAGVGQWYTETPPVVHSERLAQGQGLGARVGGPPEALPLRLAPARALAPPVLEPRARRRRLVRLPRLPRPQVRLQLRAVWNKQRIKGHTLFSYRQCPLFPQSLTPTDGITHWRYAFSFGQSGNKEFGGRQLRAVWKQRVWGTVSCALQAVTPVPSESYTHWRYAFSFGQSGNKEFGGQSVVRYKQLPLFPQSLTPTGGTPSASGSLETKSLGDSQLCVTSSYPCSLRVLHPLEVRLQLRAVWKQRVWGTVSCALQAVTPVPSESYTHWRYAFSFGQSGKPRVGGREL